MPTPLTTPPTPPNSNTDRAMFVWGDTPGSGLDPMATEATQTAVLTCCGTNGGNVIFLDIWNYLGGANWNLANRNAMKKFVSAANQSGIRVYALAGNTDWGHNLQWVGQHIVRRIAEFNVAARSVPNATYEGAQFDGVMFDVEYYTIPGYDAQIEVVGLIELLRATRQILAKPVGAFIAAFAINGQNMIYNGLSKTEGQHLVDHCDHLAVGCYDCNDGVAAGANQIAMFQPWCDYARASTIGAGLWCGSEVGLVAPDGYKGKTRATMELSHTAISNTFATSDRLAFRGICIDAYLPYSTMP